MDPNPKTEPVDNGWISSGKQVDVESLKSVMRTAGISEKKLGTLKAKHLTVWARVNRRCWAIGATHEHETYVTDENGNRFSVDRLVLHSNIGGDARNKDGVNTSQVARTETEVKMGCRSSGCCGTATIWGVSWSTPWVWA